MYTSFCISRFLKEKSGNLVIAVSSLPDKHLILFNQTVYLRTQNLFSIFKIDVKKRTLTQTKVNTLLF